MDITTLTFVLVCCLASTAGSKIKFEATPDKVTPSLTPEVSLSCSLSDTTTSGGLVGRDLHNVTETATNIKYVTMMSVLHNGNRVASVTEHIPATSLTQWPNIAVSGAVDYTSAVKGYLNITLKSPTKEQIGTFSCEIHSVDPTDYQDVHFSQSVGVSAVAPTIAQWTDHISSLESDAHTHSADLEALKQTMQSKDRELQTLTLEKSSIDAVIVSMKEQILDLTTNLTSLENQTKCEHLWSLESDGHIEFVFEFLFLNYSTLGFKRQYQVPPSVYHVSLASSFNPTLGFQNISIVPVSEHGTFHVDKFGVTISDANRKELVGLHSATTGLDLLTLALTHLLISFSSSTRVILSNDHVEMRFRDFFCYNLDTVSMNFSRSYPTPPSVYLLYADDLNNHRFTNAFMLGGYAKVYEWGIDINCTSLTNNQINGGFWLSFPN